VDLSGGIGNFAKHLIPGFGKGVAQLNGWAGVCILSFYEE
jgi:hypothetical protein